MKSYDFAVVGGGLVGGAIAYGIAKKGHSVAVLDESDVAFRASRGNFGLVWVQGKGLEIPLYSQWSMSSATLWPELCAELSDIANVDLQYTKPGGLHLCYSQSELDERVNNLNSIAKDTGNKFDFEAIDHQQLKEFIPEVGDEVYAATWSRWDGHVNPLALLRALHAGLEHHGGEYIPAGTVHNIVKDGNSFVVSQNNHKIHANKVVLAAGLGNKELAQQLGLYAPLKPVRGEIIVAERMRPLMNLPTTFLRQTGDGTIMMGDSHEDVGFNDGTATPILKEIAQRAVRVIPALANVRAVRMWGALRVMTPDGYPLYEESASHPGAFVTCCHSGVTLAAAHARRIANWVTGGEKPTEITPFTAERFDV